MNDCFEASAGRDPGFVFPTAGGQRNTIKEKRERERKEHWKTEIQKQINTELRAQTCTRAHAHIHSHPVAGFC